MPTQLFCASSPFLISYSFRSVSIVALIGCMRQWGMNTNVDHRLFLSLPPPKYSKQISPANTSRTARTPCSAPCRRLANLTCIQRSDERYLCSKSGHRLGQAALGTWLVVLPNSGVRSHLALPGLCNPSGVYPLHYFSRQFLE